MDLFSQFAIDILLASSPSFLIVESFDADGDGDSDIIYQTNSSIYFLWNDGVGGFSLPNQMETGNYSLPLLVGDVNNDGFEDLVIEEGGTARIVLNAQTQVWSVGDNFSNGHIPPLHWNLGDFTNDGFLDVVCSRNDVYDILIVESDAGGGFSNLLDSLQVSPSQAAPQIEVGDVNGDGFNDILSTLPNSRGIVVYQLDSGGTAWHQDTLMQFHQRNYALLDLDGDGDLDLADQRGIEVYLNNADSVYPTFSSVYNGSDSTSISAYGQLGCGVSLDVLHYAEGSNNELRWSPYSDLIESFIPPQKIDSLAASTVISHLQLADLNGDGKEDIILVKDGLLSWKANLLGVNAASVVAPDLGFMCGGFQWNVPLADGLPSSGDWHDLYPPDWAPVPVMENNQYSPIEISSGGKKTLYYTALDSTYCAGIDSAVFDFVYPGIPTITSGPNTLCVGDTASFSVYNAGYSGIWSPAWLNPDGAIDLGEPATGATYTIYDSYGRSCVDYHPVSVMQYSYGWLSISDTMLCTSDTGFFVSGVGMNASLSGPFAYSSFSQGFLDPSGLNPGTYPVTVVTSSPGSCGSSITATVTIMGGPEVSMPSDTVLCLSNVPVQFNVDPAGGLFSGNGTNSSGLFDPGLAGLGIHQVIYSVGDSMSGCFATDTIQIEVTICTSLMDESSANSIYWNSELEEIMFTSDQWGGAVWRLTDSRGRLVKQGILSSSLLQPFSHEERGVYFIEFRKNGARRVLRLSK